MNDRPIAALTAFAASLTLLAGCGSRGGPAGAGDLLVAWPRNVSAQVEGGGSWSAAKVSWGNYSNFQVTQVLVDDRDGNLSPEDVGTLTGSLTSALTSAFGNSRSAVGAAAPGTLVVTAEIVQAVPNEPLRNVVPLSQIRKAGYGTVTIDCQVTDGGTGALLYAFRGTADTQRVSAEKLSVWGSAEKSFGEWATQIAQACGGS